MSIDNEEAWFVTPQLHSLTLILLYIKLCIHLYLIDRFAQHNYKSFRLLVLAH